MTQRQNTKKEKTTKRQKDTKRTQRQVIKLRKKYKNKEQIKPPKLVLQRLIHHQIESFYFSNF